MLGRNSRTRTSKEIKMQIAKMVAGGLLEGLCMQLLHAPKAFKRKEEEKKKKKGGRTGRHYVAQRLYYEEQLRAADMGNSLQIKEG